MGTRRDANERPKKTPAMASLSKCKWRGGGAGRSRPRRGARRAPRRVDRPRPCINWRGAHGICDTRARLPPPPPSLVSAGGRGRALFKLRLWACAAIARPTRLLGSSPRPIKDSWEGDRHRRRRNLPSRARVRVREGDRGPARVFVAASFRLGARAFRRDGAPRFVPSLGALVLSFAPSQSGARPGV